LEQIPVSIVHCAVGLLFTASTSLIPIAQFGSRGSSPKNTTNLAHTLDQLKNNQQLLGEVAEVRNKLVGPGEVRTKVKAEKITAKSAAWLFSLVRKGFR
jgi:hypothetical protein